MGRSVLSLKIILKETNDYKLKKLEIDPPRVCFPESGGKNGNISDPPLFQNTQGNVSSWDFHLKPESPCIDAGNPEPCFFNECIPPGMGTLLNDMGAYGGPLNCLWGNYVGKQLLIDFLLGRNDIPPGNLSDADKNADNHIDISDFISLF